MADIKTHYRELSFTIKIHSLINNSPLPKDIYNPKCFLKECNSRVKNSVDAANNILSCSMNDELENIINNGFKLANAIYENPHFKFNADDNIYWVGGETQKDDLIDVIVGNYDFSLKENSYILENMGLYKYLNIFTNSSFKRGTHVFNDFAPQEYNEWFNITWQLLLNYFKTHTYYCYSSKKYVSKITLVNSNIVLDFNKNGSRTISEIPISISSWQEFMNYTKSKTREKVFAKWISEECADNEQYLESKSKCSNVAGANLVHFIKQNLSAENIKRFLQIRKNEYYYAKTTDKFIGVYFVPALKDFDNTFDIKNITYSVPSSQLNIITTIENKTTHEELIFRNECRFSHGQFNGTPEAKMYYDKGNDISQLYIPIICES